MLLQHHRWQHFVVSFLLFDVSTWGGPKRAGCWNSIGCAATATMPTDSRPRRSTARGRNEHVAVEYLSANFHQDNRLAGSP